MPSRRQFLAAIAATATSSELHWHSIDEAAALIRSRKLSPVELTKHCLARIDKLDPALRAFITVTGQTALADAKRLESEKPRGPLHGIPIALKDLYDTKGIRTTAASRQFANRVPDEDAEVVRKLKAAGAVIVGKANMDEFAFNYTGETSYFGTARNPWDPQLSPGGSSGGSAVAVAAGLCFAALGSDTGGSIRQPAAFCGITGFKPTYGRLSTRGVLPLAWTLDTVGPMARTARDAEILFRAMGGGGTALKSPRYGMPRHPSFTQMDGETLAIVEAAIRAIPGVRETAMPAIPPAPELADMTRPYLRVINAEAYAYHREMLTNSPQNYHPQIRTNLLGGASVSAADYIDARRELDEWRVRSAELFTGVDLLLTPTTPGPAFPLGKPGTLLYLRNTALWNLFGLPTISVPCGFTKSGLPVGLQITGRAGADALVLAAAAEFQKRHPFRRPAGNI
ncbi:MAG: amidase [Bryobacterales bacterium]|nr:amidase [Bryobacterales bacterium]